MKTKTTDRSQPKSLHIAPMLDVSGREFRQLIRILSSRAVLWTEMVVDTTIIHTQEIDYHLDYERENSHPIVCQIGGNDAELIRKASKPILDYDYSELNVNFDCPSDRVAGKRQFGAVLMTQPDIAESVVLGMLEATICCTGDESPDSAAHDELRPISVKCRIGVDDIDTLDDLVALIGRLRNHCRVFYVHARKAILGGLLNPAQNRSIPPLNYPRVYQICRLFPDCDFYINGGIKDLKAAKDICYGRPNGSESYGKSHGTIPCLACGFQNGSCVAPLSTEEVPCNLRGCMLGRIAIDNPCILWDIDRYFYGEESNPSSTRREIFEKYCKYIGRVYPRRCCDQDPRVTSKITHPKDFDFEYDACQLCADLQPTYSNMNGSISVAPPSELFGNSAQVKIATIVVDRCIKPINGIFYGLPKAKLFRQEINRLARDLKVRNCGPAALISRALRVVPDELLDQELIASEEV
jgi:tRNA-dihydrouridine synthase A